MCKKLDDINELENLLKQGEENKKKEEKEKKDIAAKNLGFEDVNQMARYNAWRKKNNLPTKSKDPNYLNEFQDWKNKNDYNRVIYYKGRTQKESQEALAKNLGFEDHNQKQRYDAWRRKRNLPTKSRDSNYLNEFEYWKENIDKNRIISQKDRTQKDYNEASAKKLGFEDNNQKQRYDAWRKKNNLSKKSKDPDYLNDVEDWKEKIDCNRTIPQKGRTQKEANEALAKKLGFQDHKQKHRYDAWRRKNNLVVDSKNLDYIKGIEEWKENVDKK